MSRQKEIILSASFVAGCCWIGWYILSWLSGFPDNWFQIIGIIFVTVWFLTAILFWRRPELSLTKNLEVR